jgi:hypothetical protein
MPEGTYQAVRCLGCGAIYYSRRYAPDAWDSVQSVPEQAARAARLETTGDWWDLTDGRTPAQQIATVEGYYDILVARLNAYRGTMGVGCGRLIEIGPGIGRFARRASTAGWQVLAIEPDLPAAAVCGRHVHTLPGRLDQIAPAALGQVEAVVLLDVLEHTHSPYQDLCLLRDVARAGCVLLAKTFREDHVKGPWYRGLGHEWHLTQAQWERWIGDAGWTIWTVENDDVWGQITIWAGIGQEVAG